MLLLFLKVLLFLCAALAASIVVRIVLRVRAARREWRRRNAPEYVMAVGGYRRPSDPITEEDWRKIVDAFRRDALLDVAARWN